LIEQTQVKMCFVVAVVVLQQTWRKDNSFTSITQGVPLQNSLRLISPYSQASARFTIFVYFHLRSSHGHFRAELQFASKSRHTRYILLWHVFGPSFLCIRHLILYLQDHKCINRLLISISFKTRGGNLFETKPLPFFSILGWF
jgi:hypothetical protein